MRGSAWEFEIGTERLQDKENNVLGDDDEINQVKIHKCSKKMSPKKCIDLREFLKNLVFRSHHVQKLQFYHCKNAISENVWF